MSFTVDVNLGDLSFWQRRALRARQDICALRDVALQHVSRTEYDNLASAIDGVLLTIRLDDRSTAGLDDYVRGHFKRILAHRKLPKSYRPPIHCKKCATPPAVPCDSIRVDSERVAQSGRCIADIKAACDLAVGAMQALYEPIISSSALPSAVAVQFTVDEHCPTGSVAGFCIAAASCYEDSRNAMATIVTIEIGVRHWGPRSYAALAVVLGHELICHAGHGLLSASRRTTAPTDSFSEGWMDFVSRTLVVARAKALKRLETLAHHRVEQAAAEVNAWRIGEAWHQPCQEKANDRTASLRSRGVDDAAIALSLFEELGDEKAFFNFSAAFNAQILASSSREQLLSDVETSHSLYRPAKSTRQTRIKKLFGAYIRDRDISALPRIWKMEEDQR